MRTIVTGIGLWLFEQAVLVGDLSVRLRKTSALELLLIEGNVRHTNLYAMVTDVTGVGGRFVAGYLRVMLIVILFCAYALILSGIIKTIKGSDPDDRKAGTW